MYPGYRFMDLPPQQGFQMSYAPHHGSGFEPVPCQYKVDTARPPVNHESFPCYGSYGFPYPMPYHGCCHHNQIPEYHGYGPHYPPPAYAHGSYPPYPGSYPFQYHPSMHYSGVAPRYEYDKKGSGDHHCCGCPNHLCQQKENKNVKIEEQTPDDEKNRIASLVPSELKDLSYPVTWIPPGYKRNEEGAQTIKSESKEEENYGCDKDVNGSLKSFAQEPSVWNGWLPINLNNLSSLIQRRDEKETKHQQTETNKSLFPGKPEQEETLKLKDGDQTSNWGPSQLRMFPVKFLENHDKKSMPKGDKEDSENSNPEDGPKTVGKNVVHKIIPVKQIDQTEEKGISKHVEKFIPVKQMDQTGENKVSIVEKKPSEMPLKPTDKEGQKKHLENNGNGQSIPSKASKFPPVCLRVDPSPSRRDKIGRSRSLNPPANKGKSEKLSHEKSSSSSTMQGNKQQVMQSSLDSDQGRVQSKTKVKNIQVVDSAMRNNKREDQKEVPSQYPVNVPAGGSQEKVSTSCQAVKGNQDCAVGDKVVGQYGDGKCETGADGGPINIKELVQCTNGAPNQKFSDAEAAGKCETGADGGPINTKELEVQCTNGAPDQKFSEAEAAGKCETGADGGPINTKELEVQCTNGAPDQKFSEAEAADKCETGADGGPINTKKLEVQCTNGAPDQKFSEAEAAAVIQSAYRGFEVRRWEPLKKLKEIAKIQEELIKIRASVKNLVSLGSGSEGKQRIVIGENIMNLLLQLDTMQGLHPSIRNARKSVAKELVSLQEELDSLTIRNSEELKEPEESKHAEEISKSTSDEGKEQAGEDRHKQDKTSASHTRSDIMELSQGTDVDVNLRSVDAKESELMLGSDEMCGASEGKEPDSAGYVESNTRLLEPLIVVEGQPSEVHGVREDHDSLQVESKELPLSIVAEEKLDPAVQLQNLSSLVDSGRTSKDGVTKVKIEMPLRVSEQGSDDQVSGEVVKPGELVSVSGLVLPGNKAKEISAEEQQPENLLPESSNLSDLKDKIATAGYSEGSSDLKDNISGEEMLGSELEEASKAEDVGDIKEAANVCDVEGDDKPVDDMQTADTAALEKKEIPEANAVGEDVGPVEDMEFVDTSKPEVNDLSMATLDSDVKQQTLSFVKETISEEKVVPTEEIGNCNLEQKMAVDEGQEMWEGKFDNMEISQKHSSNGNIVDLAREGDLVGEEFVTKQPHKEVPASSSISGQISNGTGTEGDRKLVEENEKLKETVEKLIAAGKEQLTAISSLSGRVKDLEKKLSRKKKLKMRRHKGHV